VQPDPISGMHCWHQRVTLEKAGPDDRYGDVFVDTNISHQIYKRWLAKARRGPGPGGLRRPLWMNRPLRPTLDAFHVKGADRIGSRDAVPSEETWYYMI